MACTEYEAYYEIIRAIPRGRVMTYGDVARCAGRAAFARRVGYALSSLSDPSVPWWRVVNGRGEISARRCEGGPDDWQRALLRKEGVRFDGAGRIDLDRYRHDPFLPPPPRRRPARPAR